MYATLSHQRKITNLLKEERKLELTLYFKEKKEKLLREQEEAAKEAASNTQASSGDSDQTAAGSCTASVNSNTETMATNVIEHLAADACFKLRRERRSPLLEKEPRINTHFLLKHTKTTFPLRQAAFPLYRQIQSRWQGKVISMLMASSGLFLIAT
jgi:hypothetical protein